MARTDLTTAAELHALLGAGTEFEGKLVFAGRVRVDGKLTGEIVGGEVLVLGETAEVDAQIEVATLIVRGATLRGTVRASRAIEVHAPSRVYADLAAPELFVDRGVVLEGRCAVTSQRSPAMPPLAVRAPQAEAKAAGEGAAARGGDAEGATGQPGADTQEPAPASQAAPEPASGSEAPPEPGRPRDVPSTPT
jgi:cytoskeletal protein CcmA (bactofilin family)